MQCVADLAIRMVKEVTTRPFEHRLSGDDVAPGHNSRKTMEQDNDALKSFSKNHEKTDIPSQTKNEGDTDSDEYGSGSNLTNGVEGSSRSLPAEASGIYAGFPIESESSHAYNLQVLPQDKVISVADGTPQAVDFSGGRCVEWVERYVGKLSSSDYKTVWTNSGDQKRHKELRIRRQKKHLHSFMNDQHASKCILSVESNASLCGNNATSVVDGDSTSSEVRIGRNYQVALNKVPISSRKFNSIETFPILMWDPRHANEAKRNGEDVDGFLSKADDLNLKLLLVEALHKSRYNVPIARQIFISLYNRNRRYSLGCVNSEDFSKIFETDRFAQTKDFEYIAKKLNWSTEKVLIYYYRWKRSKPNNPDHYLRMKSERNKESDVCKVCGNGGNLIVCDHCNKAYHFPCLTPPLTVVPHGEWFCPECETRSPAKLRRNSGYNKMSSPSHVAPTAIRETGSDQVQRSKRLKSNVSDRLDSLKLIHKELSRCVKRPKIYSAMELSPARAKTKAATYSPAGMTWDSERGFWVESAINEERRSLSLKGKGDVKVNDDKATKSINSVVDEVNQSDSSYTFESNSSSDCDVDESEKAVDKLTESPSLVRGETYVVKLPMTAEGLLIYIEKSSSRFTSFSGYRRTSMGDIGFAQKVNAFRAAGDFILEVDNISCFDKTFSEVRSLLKMSKPGWTIKLLKMFHPFKVGT
jgi:PHD-finger